MREMALAIVDRVGYDGAHERGSSRVYWGLKAMSLPNGAELAWFLSGMWATIFILRAGRASSSGFFAVAATLVLAVVPAIGLLFETQVTQVATAVAQAIHSR
jgi:hypothetical protein